MRTANMNRFDILVPNKEKISLLNYSQLSVIRIELNRILTSSFCKMFCANQFLIKYVWFFNKALLSRI